MNAGSLSTMMSSEKMDWKTPQAALRLVREVAGGPIALDPCTDGDNWTEALKFFTPEADGLKQSWAGSGLAYANPPYGRALAEWSKKFAIEAVVGGRELIVLVPARPDTNWWHASMTKATKVCFLKGRIRFVGAKDAAPFPSAFGYFGPNVDRFVEVFGAKGWIP